MITESDEMVMGKTQAECLDILHEKAVAFHRGEESYGVLMAVAEAVRRHGVPQSDINACFDRAMETYREPKGGETNDRSAP